MSDYGLLELQPHPDGTTESSDKTTIVFIHGINGHRINTWKSIVEEVEEDEDADELASENDSWDDDDDEDFGAEEEGAEEYDDDDDDDDDTGEKKKKSEGSVPKVKVTPAETSDAGDIDMVDFPPDADTNEAKVVESGQGVKKSGEEEKDEEEADGGVMWPKDLLPLKFPNSRILTYGFDSSSSETMSKDWIRRVARNLLEALTSNEYSVEKEGGEDGSETKVEAEDSETVNGEGNNDEDEEEEEDGEGEEEDGEEQDDEKEDDKTALVFVCHDLGGVILKEMLWLANNERLYLPIAVRTQLLIFFGTPHRSSSASPWEDLIFDIGLASTEARRDTRRQLMTAIVKAGADGIRDISERFNQLAGQYKGLNFHALEKSEMTGSVVVPEENAGTNAPLQEHRGLELEDHITMCHFEDENDDELLEIVGRIERVTSKRFETSFAVRETFSTRQPQRNWPILPPTDDATMHWITTSKSVSDWLDSDKFSILQVYGDRGSGKTVFAATLEKFLQGSGSKFNSTAIISFSFDRSSYCGRSFGNMLESLVRELLSQSPAVDAALSAIHKGITSEPPTASAVWTQEAMCLLFSAAVDCFEYPIVCIIDGIQDCDSTQSDMLQFMARLGRERTGEAFKLLISSREELTAETLGLESSELENSLYTVDLNDESIVHNERHRIIKTRLTEYVSSSIATIPEVDLKIVIEKFCHLSLTFLEVEFITKKLQAQSPSVASVLELRRALDNLAHAVGSPLYLIYERHLNFDFGTKEEWAFIEQVLPWLVYAEEPLTLDQLGVVQNLEQGLDPFSTLGNENMRSKDVAGLLQRTLGSLIVIDGDKVVFAHETVEDFLQQHPKLCANIGDPSKVHARIASKCLEYLTSSELEEMTSFVEDEFSASSKLVFPGSASPAYEFLKYATHHWPTHYRFGTSDPASDEQEAGDQERDLSLFKQFKLFFENEKRVCWWRELFHYLETDSLVSNLAQRVADESHIPYHPLKLASTFGLVSVVRELLHGGRASEEEQDEKPDEDLLWACLEVAASNNHESVVRAIVEFCEKENVTKVGEAAAEWDPENTALKGACGAGNVEIVQFLLAQKPNADLNACLHIASGAGHPKVVGILVDAGADVNSTQAENARPLHRAAGGGFSHVIRQLLALGADLNAADDDNYTPLHFAAMNGHLGATRVLLSQPESDINAKRWSIKPLHAAARNGHVALVKELLAHDPPADVTATSADGSTPLHMAAMGPYVKTMKVLLDNGADACVADKTGMTPLHSATPSLKAVELLLEHGADPDAATSDTRRRPLHTAAQAGRLSVVKKLLDCGATVDPAMQENKLTPLLLAAYYEHVDCVERLLREGANAHAKCGPWPSVHPDIEGMTGLHLAWGHIGVIETLMKHYSPNEAAAVKVLNAKNHSPFFYAIANRNFEACEIFLNLDPTPLDEKDHDNWLPIHNVSQYEPKIAIKFLELFSKFNVDLNSPIEESLTPPIFLATRNKHTRTVRWLIDHGADVNSRDSLGWTALHVAACEDDLETMKVLIEAGADIEAVDNLQWRVIHRITRKKNFEALIYLLEKGADVNVRDEYQWTPLHLASCEQQFDMMKALIEAGADIHAKDMDEWRVIHRVARDGNVEALKYLLEKGADVHVKEKDLWTPLHFAAITGSLGTVKLLIEVGADVNAADNTGITPLLRAAAQDADCVRCLVENGANVIVCDNDIWAPLHFAAAYGSEDCTALAVLFEAGAEVEIRDNEGCTPLHRAARNDNGVHAIRYLIEKAGADVTAKDNDGWSSMHYAACRGRVDILAALHESDADINETDGVGATPLHRAANEGKLECVRWLLENGADREIRDDKGWLPIHCAASGDHPDAMAALHEVGCDINETDNTGWTPLLRAACDGNLESVRWLLSNGANKEICDTDGWSVMHCAACGDYPDILAFLHESGVDINQTDYTGWTPLLRAARDGNLESVRWLLSNGADKEICDTDGWSVMHCAACGDHSDILAFLHESGVDLNQTDNTGSTPLHRAARDGNLEPVRWLLENGADREIRDNEGWLPIHCAASGDHPDAMAALHEVGCDINQTDNNGWTPLLRSARDGNLESVRWLLENGADRQIRDKDGWTALYASSWGDDVEILEVLLEHGARVDELDNEQWGPLHAACANGCLEIVKFLLKNGADLEGKNVQGETPLLRATASGHAEIMKLLIEEYEADLSTTNEKGDTLMRLAMSVREDGEAVVQVLTDAGLTIDLNQRDFAGRTYLFHSAAGGGVEQTKMLLEMGIDKNAVDEIGRTALDVCLFPEIREMLGADLEEEKDIDMTCATLVDGDNDSRQAYCDICMGDAMTNEFFYHCCADDCLSPEDGAFVACVPCYQNGGRCKNPEEHQMLIRYMGNSMESLEEYSPWVKTLTIPKNVRIRRRSRPFR